jgi:hypothetical protein
MKVPTENYTVREYQTLETNPTLSASKKGHEIPAEEKISVCRLLSIPFIDTRTMNEEQTIAEQDRISNY